ncbi:MAG: sensor histidine kinase [Rhodanobacter sp.]
MSLRLQLNLLVAVLMVVFTAVVLAFQLNDTRARVREDTDSASKVAAQMLTYFVDTYADASEPVVRQSLQRLGHVRSTDMTLHDAHGRVVYQSPPSPYKVGLNAPGWYTELVAPASLHYQLPLAGSVLDIQSNSSRAVLDGWDDTVELLQLGVIVMVLGNLLVFWLVGRSIRPLRDIVRGLEDMQGGIYLTRLPEFKSREARAISQAFNRMAQAVEESLDARREVVEAKLRLEQSRDLATVVQSRIEDERRQIARELHDETGQSITAIKSMALFLTLHSTGHDEAAREAAQLIVDTAGKLYASMHDLIPRLSPLTMDNLELAEAIEDRLIAWRRQQPQVEFTLKLGTLPPNLGESYALAAYRIVQEAVTNALRHAQPRHIEIELGSDPNALHVDVRDDGRGLAPDWQLPGHYGVRGMRERARTLGGDVEIENMEAGGVRTHARLPLE